MRNQSPYVLQPMHGQETASTLGRGRRPALQSLPQCMIITLRAVLRCPSVPDGLNHSTCRASSEGVKRSRAETSPNGHDRTISRKARPFVRRKMSSKTRFSTCRRSHPRAGSLVSSRSSHLMAGIPTSPLTPRYALPRPLRSLKMRATYAHGPLTLPARDFEHFLGGRTTADRTHSDSTSVPDDKS